MLKQAIYIQELKKKKRIWLHTSEYDVFNAKPLFSLESSLKVCSTLKQENRCIYFYLKYFISCFKGLCSSSWTVFQDLFDKDAFKFLAIL